MNGTGLVWRKRDWLWVALIGLALQAFWTMQIDQPTYMDAYYYTTNGQRLAEGYGFTELVVWQYLDAPAELPAPSHSYWMPLTSLLAAAGYVISDQFWAAQLPFWLLAGLLPLLTAVIGLQFFTARWQMWTAVLLTASGGFYSRFFSQPSTFAPFAWSGGLCLLFLAWGLTRRQGRWWLLAGIMAGLAHLTRADGVLLLLVGVWIWLLEIRDWRLEIGEEISNLQSLAFLLVGYLLAMGGWLVRNWLVWGRPLSAAGAQTIFLTTYDDLFAYGRTFGLAHWLAWGWDNILRSRLDGLVVALQTFVAVSGLVFLAPFIVWAWVKWGRGREKRLYLRALSWYALALFFSMSLIFTFPGSRGGLFHSSAALWPWMMVLATGGIGFAVDWAAARLSHWQPARAKPIFSALFVAVALVMSVAIGALRASDSDDAAAYARVGEMLPPDAVVMVGNPPGFTYHTGLPALSVPNEPVDVLLQAAQQYDVTHLLLDENHPLPLADLYAGAETAASLELIYAENTYQLYALDLP